METVRNVGKMPSLIMFESQLKNVFSRPKGCIRAAKPGRLTLVSFVLCLLNRFSGIKQAGLLIVASADLDAFSWGKFVAINLWCSPAAVCELPRAGDYLCFAEVICLAAMHHL